MSLTLSLPARALRRFYVVYCSQALVCSNSLLCGEEMTPRFNWRF
jgi:hypothetical protein